MRIITPNKKLFGLIYGQSGSGKTHLSATIALLNPNDFYILVDADQGSETLEASALKNLKNLFVIDFDEFKDLDAFYKLCEKNTVADWVKAIPGLEGKLTKPIRGVIMDTWTEMQWTMMQKLRKDNDRAGSGLNFRKNIEIQHWGQMTDLNKLAINAFKDLPIECLFLMQAETTTDAITGATVKGPAIHGKLVLELPAMFSTVIYTYNTPTGGFMATTLPKLGWPAKVRGRVGKDLANPTMKELLM